MKFRNAYISFIEAIRIFSIESYMLEQIEKDTIKENIVARQQERDVPQLYELDSEPEYSSIKDKPKHEIKYSSFLED